MVRPEQLGRVHRRVRQDLRLRQADLASRSGVSRNKVSFIETGRLDQVTIADLAATFAAMDAWLDLRIQRRGAELDRLLDDGHARLVAEVSRCLRDRGWRVETEVTFSEYGERGSIDVLAWHEGRRVLLVIEVKTELGSVEGLLRPLDVKVRHAAKIARERFGWRAHEVARLVVMPEDRTIRRHVERHAEVFSVALPDRSHQVRRWLAEPLGRLSGLWFLTPASNGSVKRNPSAIRRVRRAIAPDQSGR